MKITNEELDIEIQLSKDNDKATDRFIDMMDSLFDKEVLRYTKYDSFEDYMPDIKAQTLLRCVERMKDIDNKKGKPYLYFVILIRSSVVGKIHRIMKEVRKSYRIDFIAGAEMFKGLLAGAPSIYMLNNEISKMKELVKPIWNDTFEDHLFIAPELESKQEGDKVGYSHIACAELSKDATSKNPDMCGSTMFFIWGYHGDAIESSLSLQVRKADWDKLAHDWDY